MKRILTFIFSLLLSISLCSCKEDIPLEKGEYIFDIMVASDLHYLSDELLSPENELYRKENMTRDGRYQEKDVEILHLLIDKVKKEKPKALVLTGDLTFNGEKKSHEDLIKELDVLKDITNVYVIPGNHDIEMDAHSFFNDQAQSTPSIRNSEFETLYENYGYNKALFKDQETHSYVISFDSSHWGLMLDTTLNRFNYEYGESFTSGELYEPTLTWIESILKKARDKNIHVMSFSHHNLYTHHPAFDYFYTLQNANQVLDLYRKYNVTLNFSGHLHIQNIKEENGIYDIASGSLLDYGNRVGKLSIYENAYEYEAIKVSENEIFNEASFNCFYHKYYIQSLAQNQRIYGENGEKITDLLSKINTYYFDGDYLKVHEMIEQNSSLISLIKQNEGDYFKEILNVENKNQHEALIAKK